VRKTSKAVANGWLLVGSNHVERRYFLLFEIQTLAFLIHKNSLTPSAIRATATWQAFRILQNPNKIFFSNLKGKKFKPIEFEISASIETLQTVNANSLYCQNQHCMHNLCIYRIYNKQTLNLSKNVYLLGSLNSSLLFFLTHALIEKAALI
jgi:hypothetical protein